MKPRRSKIDIELENLQLRGALKRLILMARTTGGTAGRDEGLVVACEQAEDLLVELCALPTSAMATRAVMYDTADAAATTPSGEYGSKVTDIWLASLARAMKMRLTKVQGDLIRLIMQECDTRLITDRRQVAYILGTCYHECLFKSIEEIRDKPGTEVYRLQEKYWYGGYKGRGPVQLTGEKNYRKMSAVVGIDLVKNPEAALRLDVGARILVVGMATGMFTGHDLGDYFPSTGFRVRNWLLARQIVNGMFRAKLVATAALKILPLL